MTNIIQTQLPLPAETMVRFFKDKANTSFVIDYTKSLEALRTPQAVLNYIANLKLCVVELANCDITPELLNAFAVMRDSCDIEPLTRILANVLYFCKYGEILYVDSFDLFPFDSIVEYVQSFNESILIQSAFLNSLPLFTIVSESSTPDTKGADSPMVTTVDGSVHPQISTNLFNLFTLEHFLIEYLATTVPLESQIYFEPHFDRNMYQGKSMFGWFAVSTNTYFLLCKHITDSMKSASTRIELVDLYGKLLSGTQDSVSVAAFNSAIAEQGGIYKFVNATRKDIAEINREAKRAKKRNVSA